MIPRNLDSTTRREIFAHEFPKAPACAACGMPQSIAIASWNSPLATLDWLAGVACPLSAGLCATRRRALSAVFRP